MRFLPKKLSFGVIIFLAVVVGLYPLTYLSADLEKNEFFITKSVTVLTNPTWTTFFTIHLITSGISLFIGWIQFLKKLRVNRPIFHRYIGRVYFFTAIMGGFTGLYLAYYSNTLLSKIGFCILALLWLGTSLYSLYQVSVRNFVLHSKWALRSYSITFAAVTFRLLLGLLGANLSDYETAFGISSWLCWGINLLVIEFVISKNEKRIAV